MLAIRITEGFRNPLALVVARAGSKRVDVAPIGFRLGVNMRITVYFCLLVNGLGI